MPLAYISVLLWGWMVTLHPFYISLCDLRYNPTSQKVEMTQKIFWDDLEKGLDNAYQQKVNILKPENPEALNLLIKKYLADKVSISVNGTSLNMNYLGYEVEEDAVWVYLESNRTNTPKEVNVRNEILLDDFEEQQNVINFDLNGKIKSLLLHPASRKGTLKFD